MKRTTKRLLAVLLCLAVLPVDGLAVWAQKKALEPPAYLRELSRLVAETASADDFGEIKLTVGEPEMEVDGDGLLTLKDIAQIARYIAGGWNADIDLTNADVNGDGVVNLKDVVLLRRFLAGGWNVELT